MNTDQSLSNFKQRLRELLPLSQELQSETRVQLWRQCSRETREILNQAIVTCFRIPVSGGQWQTVLSLLYPGSSSICQRSHWDSLDEVCKRIYELAGITEIYIRGSDLCHRCRLDGDTWIREVL